MRRFLPFAALLGVVLVLGCQEQGPVGPDGLVPRFNKAGSINKEDCEATPGKVFDAREHCHDGEEPVVRPMFDVDVTSTSFHVSFSGVTDPKSGGEIIVDEDMLTLSQAFFDGPLTCSLGAVAQTASLWIAPGEDHVHLFFQFEFPDNEARAGYTLELLGNRPDNWPPTADNGVEIEPRNGGGSGVFRPKARIIGTPAPGAGLA